MTDHRTDMVRAIARLARAVRHQSRVSQEPRTGVRAYRDNYAAAYRVLQTQALLYGEIEKLQTRERFDQAADLRQEAEEIGSRDLQDKTGIGIQACSVFGSSGDWWDNN